jgi:hypothetical protein
VIDDFEPITLVEPRSAAIVKERKAENQKKASPQIKEKKNVYAKFDHIVVSAP